MKHLHIIDLHHPSGKFSNLTYFLIRQNLRNSKDWTSDFKNLLCGVTRNIFWYTNWTGNKNTWNISLFLRNVFLFELGKKVEHTIWQQQEIEKITYWESSQFVFFTYYCEDRYNQTKCSVMGRWKMNTWVWVEKHKEKDHMWQLTKLEMLEKLKCSQMQSNGRFLWTKWMKEFLNFSWKGTYHGLLQDLLNLAQISK